MEMPSEKWLKGDNQIVKPAVGRKKIVILQKSLVKSRQRGRQTTLREVKMDLTHVLRNFHPEVM